MRIAIVDPYFAVGLGYQTTGWFNALVAQGHRVRVFCSCVAAFSAARSLYPRAFPPGLVEEAGGEILRLPARMLPRDVALCRGLLQHVRDFDPEMTLAVYPGTLFAREIFYKRNHLPGTLFTTFADNRAQRRAVTPSLRHTLKRAALDVAFYLLKRRYHRRAIETSDAAIMQTPDTLDYVLSRIAKGRRRAALEARCVLSPLGFDSSEIYLDAAARQTERTRLGLPAEAIVIAYSGKIVPAKRYDVWVSMVAFAMRQVPELRALLIGFREGDSECLRILAEIKATGLSDRFICIPFVDRNRLNSLYNAADLALWHHEPSIGIQESMGAGVYMIAADNPSVSHLLGEPTTGRYFRDGDFEQGRRLIVEVARSFAEGSPISRPEARKRRAELSERGFSYQSMATRLTRAANDPANAATYLRFDPGRAALSGADEA